MAGLGSRRPAGPADRAQPPPAQRGCHLQRHHRRPEPAAALAPRSLPAGHRRERVGGTGVGGGPAGGPARPRLRRPLRGAPPGGPGPGPGRAGPRAPGLPAALRRHRAHPPTTGCSSPRWTWSGTPTGTSGPSGTTSRHPRGSGTPWSTAPSCRGCSPPSNGSSGVERLAGFFRSIRAGLARAAPDGADDPRVVILTPGPLSETYFEHAYLASYLGYTLVEGRDLVVDNNRVWLRSLAGYDPVDVVIRRVDDRWCDPVELRADSLLGVPGLLEVARRGRVTVVNPLGSGVVEDPALTGLLGTLAPILLGEELALRGPETWWCGTASGLSHVLANLERLIVLPVNSSTAVRPLVASTLSTAALDELRSRIRARPGRVGGPGDRRALHQPHGDRHRLVGAPTHHPAHLRRGRRRQQPRLPPRVPGHARRPDPGRGRPDGVAHLQPAQRHQQGHLGGFAPTGPAAECLAAVVVRGAHVAPGRAGHGHSPPRSGGRPAVRAGPYRRARRTGHPTDPDRPGPPRPAAGFGSGRWRRVPPGAAVGPRFRVGVRPGVRARWCRRPGGRHTPGRRSSAAVGPGADPRRRPLRARPPHRPPGPGPGARRRDRRQPGLIPGPAGRRGVLGAGAALERHLAAGRGRRRGGGPPAQPPADPSGGGAVEPAATVAGPAGPVGAGRREHGAGLGLAVPRRRPAPGAGPVPGPAGPVGAGATTGRPWSRTCWSSRCSRPRTA